MQKSKNMSGYESVLKSYGLMGRLKKGFDYVRDYDPKYEGEIFNKTRELPETIKEGVRYDARNICKKISSRPKINGAIIAAIEGAVTEPTLARANSFVYNVFNRNGHLYNATTGEQLSWIDQNILYPVAKTQVGPLPLSTWLWLGGITAAGLATWYASKRLSGKDKNES